MVENVRERQIYLNSRLTMERLHLWNLWWNYIWIHTFTDVWIVRNRVIFCNLISYYTFSSFNFSLSHNLQKEKKIPKCTAECLYISILIWWNIKIERIRYLKAFLCLFLVNIPTCNNYFIFWWLILPIFEFILKIITQCILILSVRYAFHLFFYMDV
jgi:hypothetical protein